MQITGSYQGYTKQQNLAALQNFLKQQTQNKVSTPNSQGWQSKKDSVEISQQGRQALRESLLPPDFNLFQGPRKDNDAWLRELQQSVEEHSAPRELTPEQQKELQLVKNLYGSGFRLGDANLNFDDEFKNFIEYAMNKLGIDSQDMEEIEIRLNDNNRMTVSGLKSESDNKKLAEELNRMVLTIVPFGDSGKFYTSLPPEDYRGLAHIDRMFYYNTDFAMSADDEQERNKRAYLIELKDRADRSMKENGIDLDFMQLYRTEDGKIAGYPEEVAWYFEADIDTPTANKDWMALAVRRYANEFLDAGYDNIPNVNELNVVFKFNQGSFVDLNASA